MTKKIAMKAPIKVQVEKGKIYAWCSCGYSQKQPFCDGKHREFAPDYKSVKYTAEETKDVFFCGCKHNKEGVMCDGSHKNL